eukprot:COSAG05_NODE_4046_length_1701_cov_5.385556_1_plen_107_part_00
MLPLALCSITPVFLATLLALALLTSTFASELAQRLHNVILAGILCEIPAGLASVRHHARAAAGWPRQESNALGVAAGAGVVVGGVASAVGNVYVFVWCERFLQDFA